MLGCLIWSRGLFAQPAVNAALTVRFCFRLGQARSADERLLIQRDYSLCAGDMTQSGQHR